MVATEQALFAVLSSAGDQPVLFHFELRPDGNGPGRSPPPVRAPHNMDYFPTRWP